MKYHASSKFEKIAHVYHECHYIYLKKLNLLNVSNQIIATQKTAEKTGCRSVFGYFCSKIRFLNIYEAHRKHCEEERESDLMPGIW